ncbi:uncharacterized protein EAF02_011671 [Botrytis sinoallii]|uniref:uncharacterized protein n=1 Tax=Botrytis sinoallii TaxID=1463999 RepID=UPI0018FF5CD4|nr:uncharacterized protein EAF02_011671 [Botrytis sinoallii]KAF7854496.1 hypothetical protein EAF02_011671 [Botrytis sinoallii]
MQCSNQNVNAVDASSQAQPILSSQKERVSGVVDLRKFLESIAHMRSNEEKTTYCFETLEALDANKDDIFEYMNTVFKILKSNPAWWKDKYTEETLDNQLLYIRLGIEQNIPRIRKRRLERINYIKARWSKYEGGSRNGKRLQGSDCERAINIEEARRHPKSMYENLQLSRNLSTGLYGDMIETHFQDESMNISANILDGTTLLEGNGLYLQPNTPHIEGASELFHIRGMNGTEPISIDTRLNDSLENYQETLDLTRKRMSFHLLLILTRMISFRQKIDTLYRTHKWRRMPQNVLNDVMIMLNVTIRNLTRVCSRHQRKIAVLSGLKVKYCKQAELNDRMKALNTARLNGEEAVKALKIGEASGWFSDLHRVHQECDALGHYKFAKHASWPPRTIQERLFDNDFLKRTLSFLLSSDVTREDSWDSDAAICTWDEKGSVNIPIFKWWWVANDGEVARIVDEDLEMYKHHARQDFHGNENKGWLPTAFHSIAQQLVSQDPLHYATYTALRPDHWTSLLSYPSYAKYSEFDEDHPTTGGFEHIDQNVSKLLKGEFNINAQVQGSVSLDDEAPQNSTKIVPGFHKPGVLANWWAGIPEEYRKSGAVTRIPTISTPRLNWETVPCLHGEARFTMPQIPHGAQPRYPGVPKRRTILPWMSRVAEDHMTLPNTDYGAGTVQDVTLARVACMPPKATQSGKPIFNSRIPYRFPGCVRLDSLGALSDALLGLRRWDAPEVVEEQEILFGEDRERARKFIEEWRENATRAAKKAFEIGKKTEMRIFGPDSYWNNK